MTLESKVKDKAIEIMSDCPITQTPISFLMAVVHTWHTDWMTTNGPYT